jgi:hypothetical protein
LKENFDFILFLDFSTVAYSQMAQQQQQQQQSFYGQRFPNTISQVRF